MNFYAPSWDTCKAMECFFSYGGEFFLSQNSQIEQTLFAHYFEPMRRWPLPQPLPHREGRDM